MVGVGKPLILYIRCRIHRLEVLAEAIGVNGSTATTGRYRSYRREMEVRVLHRLQINDYLFHSVDIIYSTYMNCFLRSSFVRIGCHIAGWSSWLARWPHEPKVADSSSAPATKVFFKLK